MNIHVKNRIFVLFHLTLFPLMGGCSLLGFSAYPVAHVMTKDTKDVLANTPNYPDVPRELSKEVQANHYLQPGDELLVETVVMDPDGNDPGIRLPADQQVMADGSIDIGAFGRVVIASMTLEQAEASIQRVINTKIQKSVQVNVRLIQPIHRYYVIGEVNSPGAYPLTGNETVLDAIMEAGGLTARASACDLLLARPTDPCSCRITLPVCYRAITQLGDTTTNYHLKPGDRIFVSRQSLCEEITAYVRGGKTCDRCCKKQTPCCDPRASTFDMPSFIDTGMEWIQPIDPPSSDGADVNQGDSQSVRPTEETPRPLEFDGELDFGMLLQ
ncbi:MAG: polysaccharide biosynthesis/export family protein [Planctomycetales bacterium]|nr:polysaccharide biosynthesis/export family protein [Planctomycetales bacterium]